MHLLFDMDGVLLDSMPLWRHLGERYLLSLGIAPKPGLWRTLFPMTMQEGARHLRTHYPLAQDETQIIAGLDALAASFYCDTAPLKPGVAETLAELRRRGHSCAVATATDRPLAEAAFQRTGISGHFTRIFTCSELGLPKTTPQFYQRILQELGVPPTHLVVIEDALHAIETARRAGLAVFALYDEASRDDWPRIQTAATRACQDFNQILDLV